MKKKKRNETLPLADQDFRTVINKYTQEFQGKHEHYEERNGRQNWRELLDMKNKAPEVKISLSVISNRLEIAEETICNLDVRNIEII